MGKKDLLPYYQISTWKDDFFPLESVLMTPYKIEDQL